MPAADIRHQPEAKNVLSSSLNVLLSRLRFQHTPIVYRLGHQVFILVSGVRLPVGVPLTRAYRFARTPVTGKPAKPVTPTTLQPDGDALNIIPEAVIDFDFG